MGIRKFLAALALVLCFTFRAEAASLAVGAENTSPIELGPATKLVRLLISIVGDGT